MRDSTKLVLTAAVLLAGCANDGLFKSSLPDETRVVDGPSLALPPQYNLRPPQEAKDYDAQLRQQKALDTAEDLITGTSPTTVVSGSEDVSSTGDVDQWFIDKAAQQSGVVADPNVRQELAVQDQSDKKEKAKDESKQGLLSHWFGK